MTHVTFQSAAAIPTGPWMALTQNRVTTLGVRARFRNGLIVQILESELLLRNVLFQRLEYPFASGQLLWPEVCTVMWSGPRNSPCFGTGQDFLCSHIIPPVASASGLHRVQLPQETPGGSLQQVHLTQDCAVYLSLVSTFLEAISAAASTSTNSLLSSDQRIDWPTEMSLDEALWCLNFQSQITTFLTLKRTYESSGHECTIFLGQMSNISIKCAHPLIQHKIYIY